MGRFGRLQEASDASESVLDVGPCLIGFDVLGLRIFAVDTLSDCSE
ncbi:hypothetical protein HSB1_41700 [Halogranum salarium B-1]|uniref:Uncharacterized protein n=1 Tax=Halogranum salarium B-1 TaxID=1210908 RepID=J3ETJ1_9EURY|nr:hypothetical protein HSB1_41700 [Halogranum salarium B-1]